MHFFFGITVFLATVNVVFHESVQLQCNVPNFNPKKTQKWAKGEVVLTTNTSSIDNKKYISENKENRFILKIQDLSKADLNETYYCYYDFETVPYNLTMKSDWILKPTNESLYQNISFEDDSLNVRLTLKEVFPVPSCNCTFDETEISNKFVRKISIVDIFYSVDFFLTYNTSSCGHVNITCVLKTDIIIQETRNFCHDITENESPIKSIIIGIGIAFLVFIIALAIYRWQRCKKTHQEITIPSTAIKDPQRI